MKTEFRDIEITTIFTRPNGAHCIKIPLRDDGKNAWDLDNRQTPTYYTIPDDEMVVVIPHSWGVSPPDTVEWEMKFPDAQSMSRGKTSIQALFPGTKMVEDHSESGFHLLFRTTLEVRAEIEAIFPHPAPVTPPADIVRMGPDEPGTHTVNHG